MIAGTGNLGQGAVIGGEDDVAMLVADAVDRADEDAVGDGVRTLHGLPGRVLGFAELGFLARVPADGGGVEDGVGTHQRG